MNVIVCQDCGKIDDFMTDEKVGVLYSMCLSCRDKTKLGSGNDNNKTLQVSKTSPLPEDLVQG